MSAPDLRDRHVVVAGAGVTGEAVVAALDELGAVVDVRADAPGRLGDRTIAVGTDLAGVDLVVTSPGFPPTAPLLVAAQAAGIGVWGEPEFAWRLRPAGQRWLVVTGTNGKTTTTAMLGGILVAAGLATPATATAGNIGTPLVTAVRAPDAPGVLAVELSSFQLHWSQTIAPAAAAVVNVADDHLDWHGGRDAYAAAKAKAWAAGTVAVVDGDDPGAVALARRAAPQAVRVTRAEPGPGELGIAAGRLVDRAFGPDGGDGGLDLLGVDELAVTGPHNLTDALCAAALARAIGIPPAAVAAGLAAYRAGAHRLEPVAERAGVRWVDDSKGTNPHATAAALASYDRVVWIAGGLNKGATFDDLVRAAAPRLAAVVLIGRCAEEIAAALARHAAQVPVTWAVSLDDAVRAADRLARRGDVVLLSPAAASQDMFRDYHHRGEVFAAAVRALPRPPAGTDGRTRA